MFTYIFTFLVASVIAAVSKPKLLKISKNKRICINTFLISFLIMGLLIGFRDSFAIDDSMYVREFYRAINYGYSYRTIERSYIIISRLLAYLGFNYQGLFLLYAVGGSLLIGYAVSKMTKKEDYLLTFSLIWAIQFTNLMTAVRQFLAIGLVLSGYFIFREGKRVKGIIVFALACFIHITAIITIILFVIVPQLKKINYKRKIIILLLLYILQYIPFASFFTNIVSKIPLIQNNYYVKYFLVTGAKWIFTNPLGINETIIFLLTIVVMWGVNRNKRNNGYQELGISYSQKGKSVAIGFSELEVLCFLYWGAYMFLNQFGFLRRIIWAFFPFAAVYVIQGIKFFDKDGRVFVKALFYLFFFAIFLYSLTIYSEPIIPYIGNFNVFME